MQAGNRGAVPPLPLGGYSESIDLDEGFALTGAPVLPPPLPLGRVGVR